MEDSLKVVSKGVMMGAAIMFMAIRREHTSYNYVTLALFSIATMIHVAMSLSSETLVFYVLASILIPSVLAVVAVSQPHFIFAPVLEYAPVLVVFMLCIIEECAQLRPAASFLLPWWKRNVDPELYSLSTSPASMDGSRSSLLDSIHSDYRFDEKPTMSSQDSLLLRYMWSPSQSCAPSSRLSDISLSSGWPERPPSSLEALVSRCMEIR
ncbi:hypothetical protein GGR51DRAFT_562153 [Nemania sp. FL0031]|nr:hypothetical protein GGR51DRAFT_562153 [Nemania sp. FL0031]